MIPQAGKMNYPKPEKMHTCPRHHDLTLLLQAAKKKICNSCFATLKTSYYNVIAGLLLEEHYLHNVTKGLIEQNNNLQKQIQDQQQHLLNLTHEIAEIKNNGSHHEKPRPDTRSSANRPDQERSPQSAPQDTQEIYSEGHMAKVARTLQNLLHIQIARIFLSWKKKNATTSPKTDDLQDKSIKTNPHQRKSS